jgi:hypothetical protein
MTAVALSSRTAGCDPAMADRVFSLVATAAKQSDVEAAVEANHDDNRWWPLFVSDWRIRMAVAGWSTRVSYAAIGKYAEVVREADSLGWGALNAMDDLAMAHMVRPLGLATARVGYLRSLATFVDSASELSQNSPEELIRLFAARVHGAGYKVAQCAALYARGYHCGVIPVDSGMVSKLAPFLGVRLAAGPAAHEDFRQLLEACTAAYADAYRDLVSRLGYRISIPEGVTPTWLVHLVLIYFKRLYLNRPPARLCSSRPACARFIDC